MHTSIHAKAPPLGPYSAAVKTGTTIYISGQIPLKPDGSIEADFPKAVALVMEHISLLLTNGGFALSDIVRTTVYLTDISLFPVFNDIYAQFFTAPFPTRTTVAVSALPKGAAIEIDAIAVRE